MLGVAHGHGERIGRVGGQTPFDLKHTAHHVSHLHLVCTTETHHRKLDRAWRVFGQLDRFSDSRQSRTTSLPKFQGAIDVATDEDLFDGDLGWLKLRDQLAHPGMDAREPRLHLKTIDFNTTLREATLHTRSNFEDAEASTSGARIEPQDTNRRG